MKWKKLLAGGALAAGSYFAVGNYFYNLSMKRGEKFFLNENPKLPGGTSGTESERQERKAEINHWAATAPQENWQITSFDDLQLVGTAYYQQEPSDLWMVLVHGYMTNRQAMNDFAYEFYQYGFNILTVDCRASGESAGEYTTMGWFDRLDVKQWCEELVAKEPNSEIVLLGISMGGATVMMASGEELPSNVKCIVEDCGYTSVWDIFAYQLKDLFHLPAFPVMNAAEQVTQMRSGFSIKGASAVNQLKKNTRPMLFIHGDADAFVPYEMLDQVYAATDAPKEKLVIPGAEHALAFEVDREIYMTTVLKFLMKYLG
ncbi:fermentation-respiration switch protein FrsA (DUF1100 family) [Enterococcus sp. PF1-24]|uniref:alpha/beta hydrolase n=1 Tax=unclassified Enterococcus TaxID=2608891 RepID=UPI002474E60C|nr:MULTISPECIES: alpha/beta hydrolase [unclassified Enterococcus]MDH6365504.1 fermentation-respiration switch protein FrsA (DUF1100 family) [Enterococcus sp. PFB1-1]MDH6402605.1 fermentation-respiration switch protein FrsA (DUF1100 family) [Enterococcus sp. PF1-24]